MGKPGAKKPQVSKRISTISENAMSGSTLATMSSKCKVSYTYGRGAGRQKSYATKPMEKSIVLQNNGKLLIYTQEDPFLKILTKNAALLKK